MCECESVGLNIPFYRFAEHGNITLKEYPADQTFRVKQINMPGKEKNSPSARTKKPARVADPSNPDKAGDTDRQKHAGSPAEVEIGGSKGLEPTRFGDWEKNGRCTDF